MSPEINYVYILQMQNGNYYTGYTTNLEQRLNKHINNKGAKFTKAFKPQKLRQSWCIHSNKGDAMKVEAYIKQQNRSYKELLIAKPKNLQKDFNQARELNLKIVENSDDYLFGW